MTNIRNGIININGYMIWYDAEVVMPYIIKFLQKIFPNDIIISEFNNIDLTILNQEIPVEVQSTIVAHKENTGKNPSIIHSQFEDHIRRQLEDNIENYGLCLFFFDFGYYRYLSEMASNVSLNLDWMAKYVKDSKLKIFTVNYNGIITELKYEDLTFIKKLSNTCKLECDNDCRILNRNKIKIMKSIIKNYEFTQNEIDGMRNEFTFKNENRKHSFYAFLLNQKDERKKLYGQILTAVTNLTSINEILNMNQNYDSHAKYYAGVLKILEMSGITSNSRTKFIDKFDICKYFPGYIRKKEAWDSLKTMTYSDKELKNIFYIKNKNIKTLLDF